MILDFGGLRLVDGVPIYLQIIRYVKANIISGRTADAAKCSTAVPEYFGHRLPDSAYR